MSASTSLGLCAGCRHRRAVSNTRGSTFTLCELSRVDPAFPKYPRIPVLACPGFDPEDPDDVRPEASRSPRPS